MSKSNRGTKRPRVHKFRARDGWRYSCISMWCPTCGDYVHIKVNAYSEEQHCKVCRSVTLNSKPHKGSKP